MEIKKKNVFIGTEAQCTYFPTKITSVLFGKNIPKKKLNQNVIFIKLKDDDYIKLEDLIALDKDGIQHYSTKPKFKGDKYADDLDDYYTMVEKEDIVLPNQILNPKDNEFGR